ncbi:gamma-glutamyl-gamma-aminobutyrate hydrolase family protein [Niallia sp. FSL W8-0635]|uniref:gamma-glutamyl-gamma-aminobutyrate hydrolase family protein n=1 Tax=Niallia sp. FSL W8-0635 TaxID=2975337 RepID=UPI0009CF20C1|nr:peptidase C26 [Mycobacteroides abscessus subsp. abscessus]
MLGKPIIGITGAYVFKNKFMEGSYVHHDYHKSIAANDGLPIILPFVEEKLAIEMVDICDAIILSGGEDVDPIMFGEDPHQNIGDTILLRDKVELNIIKRAMETNKPILAICRGIQILNVALGGTLIQDIPSQVKEGMKHTQTVDRSWDTHFVTIKENSKLAEIIGETKTRVNSLHHQAIDSLAEELEVVATSKDGIIEAVEHKSYRNFLLGVQWHPESMAATNEKMNRIFAEFIKSVKIEKVNMVHK